MSTTYRPLAAGDLPALAALLTRAMPRDVISARRLAQNLLLEPHHDPRGLVIAEDSEHGVVGFLYGTVAEGGIPTDPRTGYLTIGAVDPVVQRRGIGSELLDRVTGHLATRGATRVAVSGYPQAYFWPGVDLEENPGTGAFLTAHGFTPGSVAAAMHRDLDAWALDARARDLVAAREAEGYRFAPATLEDLPETIAFARERFAPDWGEVLRTAVLHRPDATAALLIARHPDGHVVGFATSGVYGDSPERFGPFGVDESQRGKGLGRILLNLTLQRMRSDAAHSAWFLWTGEQTPAASLYRSTGFTTVRRFTTFSREL